MRVLRCPLALQLLGLVVLLIGYEVAVQKGLLDSFTFISLGSMATTAAADLADRRFLAEALFPTGLEILCAFAGAAILGILGGVLLWRFTFLHDSLQPYLLLFYAIPVFALFPVLIGIFGLGPVPVILVAVLLGAPVVTINTTIGLRSTRGVLVKVGRSFRLSLWRMLREIYFPSAWPHVFAGLRMASSYSIIGVIATEFILSTHGLGHSISYAYNNFDLRHMYASILLVVLMAVVVYLGLGQAERRVNRGRDLS